MRRHYGGTVSVYVVHVYNEQERRKSTASYNPTLTLKTFGFMPLTQLHTFDCLCNNWIAANSLFFMSYSSSAAYNLLEHRHMLFQGLQSIIFTISQKCVEDENLINGGSAKTKSALCILKLEFDFFTTSLFKAFCIDFSRKT